jgi:hypothetical protein
VVLVLAFGVVLLITVALSGLAARTVLSSALIFLIAGALVGPGLLGLGMPLSLLLVAVAAHYLVGLDWTTSLSWSAPSSRRPTRSSPRPSSAAPRSPPTWSG